jgi:PIN domain nuclease of toxin-antitoxin system
VILLDTHVVLWWTSANDRLSARARRETARADSIFVSPASCWEIATLVRKNRLRLDRDVYQWISDLFEEERVSLAQLTGEIAVGGGLLPSGSFPGDPADRLLYATARELAVPFVTKDVRIREYARRARDVRTIW